MVDCETNRKLCSRCLQELPLSEFRLSSKPPRLACECRTCHNELDRLRQMRKRQEKNDLAIAAYVLKLKNARSHRRVEWLCGEMFEHFGGPKRLLKAWIGQVERLREKEPTGKKLLDFHITLMGMLEVCDAHRTKTTEPDDAALTDAIMTNVLDLLAAHPHLVLQAAESTGWTVIPPSGSGSGRVLGNSR